MECLLRKKLISEYNLKSCKEQLEKVIDEYIRVKYTYKNIMELGDDYYSQGVSYQFSDVQIAKINYSNRVCKNAIFKIENENEAERIQQDIDKLLKKLTDQEKDFFEIVLLQKRAQRIVEDKYRITKIALDPIKQSCILKACLHFEIAVLKK